MSLKSDVNKESGPLYERIKTVMRRRIASGDWPAGYRLPTLRALSDELGVAYATVERAVRELVDSGLLEGRKRGGTVVSDRSRQLRGAVGIIGDTPYGRLFTSSRYFSTLLMFIQQQVIDQQRMVVYDHQLDDQPFAEMFSNLTMIDGVIVFDPPRKNDKQLRAIHKRGMPIVTIGEKLQSPVPSVISDGDFDITNAMSVLQERGHKRIAYVTHSWLFDGPTSQVRMNAWRSAQEARGDKDTDNLLIIGTPEEQVEMLLKITPRPTALFTPQSRHFPSLFELLKGTPLEPGKYVEICTLDENLWNTITPLHIAYLSIEQRLSTLAKHAVDMLVHMIDTGELKASSKLVQSRLMQVREDGMRQVIYEGS